MTEVEQFDLYKTLEKNAVSKSEENHNIMYLKQHYTDIIYRFGDYKVVNTTHTNKSNVQKNFIHIFKGNRTLDSWDKAQQNAQYVLDIYMAAKNKNENKPFENPFNNPNDMRTIMYRFEQEISNALPKILPQKMDGKFNAIKVEMKRTFSNALKQYQ